MRIHKQENISIKHSVPNLGFFLNREDITYLTLNLQEIIELYKEIKPISMHFFKFPFWFSEKIIYGKIWQTNSDNSDI